MLLAPPGALQCVLTLCKRIVRCSKKQLQLWRCIQDATRWFWERSKLGAADTTVQVYRRMRGHLRHQCMSAADFESSWDLCMSSSGDLVWYIIRSGSYGSTTTTHLLYHIRRCNSHMILCITLCYVLFKPLYKYTYGDTGITEMTRW